jgi:hypothetical protein
LKPETPYFAKDLQDLTFTITCCAGRLKSPPKRDIEVFLPITCHAVPIAHAIKPRRQHSGLILGTSGLDNATEIPILKIDIVLVSIFVIGST